MTRDFNKLINKTSIINIMFVKLLDVDIILGYMCELIVKDVCIVPSLLITNNVIMKFIVQVSCAHVHLFLLIDPTIVISFSRCAGACIFLCIWILCGQSSPIGGGTHLRRATYFFFIVRHVYKERQWR